MSGTTAELAYIRQRGREKEILRGLSMGTITAEWPDLVIASDVPRAIIARFWRYCPADFVAARCPFPTGSLAH